MHYSFRIGPMRKSSNLRIHGHALEVLDDQHLPSRTIDLREIRKIQRVGAAGATDPETGPFTSEFSRICPSSGAPVSVRNGSWLQPDGRMNAIVRNQDDAYVEFMTEVQRRIAEVNPSVPVVSGSLAASIAWWVCMLIGLAMLALAAGGFAMDELMTAVLLAAFCVPVGVALIWAGAALGHSYWPTRTTVSQAIHR